MTVGSSVGSLSGLTVALLRSPDRGAAMSSELVRRGAETLLVPLVDWELPADTSELDRLLDAAPTYDWMVITSVTTVRALAHRAEARRLSLASLVGSARVAAVGTASRDALVERGVRVHLVPSEDQSAEGLLAALPAEPARALLPQSDLAADTLEKGLTGRGWTVDAVTAYCTVDHPAAAERRLSGPAEIAAHAARTVTREELSEGILHGTIDAVVLTSPSIAGRLHAMMGTLPETVMTVAIGRRTERDASALGLRIDAIAASPSPTGIADAVSNAVVNHRKRT
ncbi:uroporphyrinogen-III synthase [Arthrobacter sp.]|uniref:uroporphyrinogen-III synthase n=2 Tax=Arthrobacter sp. TaxID=1667 RepID=UPI0028124E23|nr:uroporphyrinogen-III synthase [Arthrobacter sp.]